MLLAIESSKQDRLPGSPCRSGGGRVRSRTVADVVAVDADGPPNGPPRTAGAGSSRSTCRSRWARQSAIVSPCRTVRLMPRRTLSRPFVAEGPTSWNLPRACDAGAAARPAGLSAHPAGRRSISEQIPVGPPPRRALDPRVDVGHLADRVGDARQGGVEVQQVLDRQSCARASWSRKQAQVRGRSIPFRTRLRPGPESAIETVERASIFEHRVGRGRRSSPPATLFLYRLLVSR